jgi:hypothetical protein
VPACCSDLTGNGVELDKACLLKQDTTHRGAADQKHSIERLSLRYIVIGRRVITAELDGATGLEVAVRFGDVVMANISPLYPSLLK